MQTYIISCFYQCLVADNYWPTGDTFTVNATTEDEALQKVKDHLWTEEFRHSDEPLDFTKEDWQQSYITVTPQRLNNRPRYNDEAGYVLQISNLIEL